MDQQRGIPIARRLMFIHASAVPYVDILRGNQLEGCCAELLTMSDESSRVLGHKHTPYSVHLSSHSSSSPVTDS